MNRNIIWGQIFVDELARSGLKAVCAAPGSRHTPLMLAFAKHPDIKVYSHLDERSAAFFALGLALASDEPVALVCSSGTAGANMYPAIIEAHQSRVPLIVLTADRPHELRHSGANQTIDQIKMFGDFVLWFVDMQLPEANPPAIAMRNLRTTANRAYATANGLRKGVVHLNFPFRKPLEPTPVEGDMLEVSDEASGQEGRLPATQFASSVILPDYRKPIDDIPQNLNGIIVCGQRYINSSILSLAHTLGYPVLADAFSGLRFDNNSFENFVSGSYETYLANNGTLPFVPEVVLRFGTIPLSKSLGSYIEKLSPQIYMVISNDGDWNDDSHRITHFIHTNVEEYVDHSLPLGRLANHVNVEKVYKLEVSTRRAIREEINNAAYFDGAVVYDVVDLIPDESTLFVGNSLPVRHLDQFGKPQQKRIYTYANRGASGIDGNISTALGAGTARPDKPLVAIFGDITFYHDMNGLLAVHRCGVPITIVLINNDGGGIFNRLPIRDYEPEFTDYFITPHGLDFSHAAKLYGLDYVAIDAREGQSGARESFREAFSKVVGSEKSTIIEVRTDSKFDDNRRKEIVTAVHQRLSELDI